MSKRFTQIKIIQQFKEIHGDIYDYSLVDYQGDSKKVKIICKEHGLFEQQVACHKRQKQGCPKCRNIKIGLSQRIGNDKFIERIENIFGKDKFDYSNINYIDAHTPIILKCNHCGSTEIKVPSVWYQGFGCLKCGGKKLGKRNMTTIEFVDKCNKVHNNIYNYSNTNYINRKSKVEIICNKHGSFFQVSLDHLEGCGCPKCKTSKGEEEIAKFLNENQILYQYQYKVKINESNHYYDFFISDKNCIIEFNGRQHYEPIEFFGGEEGFEYLKERDRLKKEYCGQNNVNLINISYKDIYNIEQILRDKI